MEVDIIYRVFQDIKVSALGMGCMRLSVIDGDYTKVDIEVVKKMVAYAMEMVSTTMTPHGDITAVSLKNYGQPVVFLCQGKGAGMKASRNRRLAT